MLQRAFSVRFNIPLSVRFGTALSVRFNIPLSVRFGTALSERFGMTMSARFSTALSARFGTALSARFGTALSARFGTALSERFGTALSARFGAALSERFSTALSARFGTALIERFGTAMSVLFLCCVGLALLGCSELDNCPDDDEVPREAIAQHALTEAGFYTSSPWEGPRDEFPAKVTLRFRHGLGATPEIVTSYISFQREGSDVAENAGNQGRFLCVDDEEIWLKNDTCEEGFFVRVAASASGNLHTCPCEDKLAGRCD